MFRSTVGNMNLLETEVDKYAVLRMMSSDNTSGVYLVSIVFLFYRILFLACHCLALAVSVITM